MAREKTGRVRCFCVDLELAQEIEQTAAELNVTVSELLREAIRFYLRHKPRLDARLKELESRVEELRREIEELREHIHGIGEQIEKTKNAIQVLIAVLKIVIENAKMKDKHRAKARRLLVQP